MKLLTFEFEGKYFTFNINAYTNLTEMCAHFGKRPNDFLSLPATQAYLAALTRRSGLPRDGVIPENPVSLSGVIRDFPASLLVTIKGQYADGRAQGTWAYPDVAIKCAAWISPDLEVWMIETIRRLLNGELIHPAMDKEDLKEREARIAGLNNKAAVEKDRYWKALEVEGNVSLRAYYKCVGLNPPVQRRMVIGRSLGNRAVAYGYPVGKVRQRRGRTGDLHSDCSGWQTVATYPPREIHAEVIRQGLLPKGTAVPPWDLLTAEMGRLTSRLYGALPELSAVEAPMDHLNAPTLGNRTTTITLNQPELAL